MTKNTNMIELYGWVNKYFLFDQYPMVKRLRKEIAMIKNLSDSLWKLCLSLLFSTLPIAALGAAGTLDSAKPQHPIKAIVFDIGGVLAYQSSWGIMSEFDKTSLLMYMAEQRIWSSQIQPRFFEVLAKIYGKQEPEQGSTCICGEGLELPKIFCDWLCGKLTGKQAIKIITNALNDPQQTIVASPREKAVITSLAGVLFNPKTIAQHTYPIAEGEKLVADCSRAGFDVYILSNYGQDSFEHLYRKDLFARLFTYFPRDHLFVSGFMGSAKPYHSIFEIFLKKSGLMAEECVFIDDQLENVVAAQRLGFQAIHLNRGDFSTLRSHLTLLGVEL